MSFCFLVSTMGSQPVIRIVCAGGQGCRKDRIVGESKVNCKRSIRDAIKAILCPEDPMVEAVRDPQRSDPSHRRRRRRRHRSAAEPYMVCLSACAVACLIVVITLLVCRPQWETLILGVPLGAFLLGGLGGLAALATFPSW